MSDVKKTISIPGLEPGEAKRKLLKVRQRGFEDLLFLAKEILDYDLIDYDLPMHRDMAACSESRDDALTLVPRGFIKSTIGTVAGTIHFNLRWPEECILIASAVAARARDFLSEITDHYSKNEKFRHLYPEWCPRNWQEEPNQDRYYLPNRKLPRKEASIYTTGADQTVTSLHFDRIVADDIVVKENVPPWSTEETMMKVWEWFQSLNALLKQVSVSAHQKVIGTRWHDADSYGQILDSEWAHHLKMCIYSTTRCIAGSAAGIHPEGESVWPAVFPHDRLKVMKSKMGPYLWACLMEQDPLPPESAVRMLEDWVHGYEESPEEGEICTVVDPAFSRNKKSDRTAITTTRVPENNGLYVLGANAGRWTPKVIYDKIVSHYHSFRPSWIGMECDAGGEAVFQSVKRDAKANGVDLPLKRLHTKGTSKDSRVMMLSHWIQTYGLYLKRGMGEVKREVVRYPVAKHRDYVDTLAYRVLRQKVTSGDFDEGQKKSVVYVPSTGFTMKGQDILDRIEGRRGRGGAILRIRA